ncbi:hypothetical protein GGR57DRAFT_472416 [Xylariaceae sp. FL1272]|nr:hypothetical protein GGR57DRAFT_472416 [Xylariaceae sp. FL1272]
MADLDSINTEGYVFNAQEIPAHPLYDISYCERSLGGGQNIDRFHAWRRYFFPNSPDDCNRCLVFNTMCVQLGESCLECTDAGVQCLTTHLTSRSTVADEGIIHVDGHAFYPQEIPTHPQYDISYCERSLGGEQNIDRFRAWRNHFHSHALDDCNRCLVYKVACIPEGNGCLECRQIGVQCLTTPTRDPLPPPDPVLPQPGGYSSAGFTPSSTGARTDQGIGASPISSFDFQSFGGESQPHRHPDNFSNPAPQPLPQYLQPQPETPQPQGDEPGMDLFNWGSSPASPEAPQPQGDDSTGTNLYERGYTPISPAEALHIPGQATVPPEQLHLVTQAAGGAPGHGQFGVLNLDLPRRQESNEPLVPPGGAQHEQPGVSALGNQLQTNNPTYNPLVVPGAQGQRRTKAQGIPACHSCQRTIHQHEKVVDSCDYLNGGDFAYGCTRCRKVGLVCVVNGVPVTTHPGTMTLKANLGRYTYSGYRKCQNCTAGDNGTPRNCDRTRPCISCREHQEPECRDITGTQIGLLRHPVPGTDMEVYYSTMGWGPGGPWDERPSQFVIQPGPDHHLQWLVTHPNDPNLQPIQGPAPGGQGPPASSGRIWRYPTR